MDIKKCGGHQCIITDAFDNYYIVCYSNRTTSNTIKLRKYDFIKTLRRPQKNKL